MRAAAKASGLGNHLSGHSGRIGMARRAEHAQVAKDWWRGEMSRLLPGEEGDHTVHVIDFYDRCKYFAYTREPVFYRAASLATHIANWGTNIFVDENPENILSSRGCVVQTPTCWLMHQADPNPSDAAPAGATST